MTTAYNSDVCKMCEYARRRATNPKRKAGRVEQSKLYWRCTSFSESCEKCFDRCKEYARLKEKYKIQE